MVNVLLLLSFLLPALSYGCSCVGPINLRSSFDDKGTTAVKVYVQNEIFPNGPLDAAGNGFRYYRAVVLRTYRGCDLPRYERILISTGGNSALCGIQLTPRTSYLLFGFLDDETVGNRRHRILSVGSCQYQAEFRNLRYYQRRYLARQPYQDICSTRISSCADTYDCNTCLDSDCVWTANQCLSSCEIQDVACYQPGANNFETCARDAEDQADTAICSRLSDCEACTSALLSNGVGNCRWFSDGEIGYCGASSGCDFNGICGASVCTSY